MDGVSLAFSLRLYIVNMENFITGYTGHEHQVRAELKARLGDDRYEYFFEKVGDFECFVLCQFLEYFFTEEDAILFAELGLNCLRIPVS